MHTCRTNYRLSDAPTRCEACALRETIYEALALGGMLAALTALTLLADLLRSS